MAQAAQKKPGSSSYFITANGLLRLPQQPGSWPKALKKKKRRRQKKVRSNLSDVGLNNFSTLEMWVVVS